MKIVVAGGTGFLGRSVVQVLADAAHHVVVLTRDARNAGASFPPAVVAQSWDGATVSTWRHHVDGADAVLNFTGSNIGGGRWTAARKREILSSRVNAGRAIGEAIGQAAVKPAVLISSSGVGYYGDVPHEEVVESREAGNDFLAKVCVQWEAAAREAEKHGVRVALLRMAVVLGKDSEVLSRMSLPFRFYVGGPLGTGRQWFPWVHLDDVPRTVMHILTHRNLCGPINVTAPQVVTMKQFCSALGRAMHRPSWAPTPPFLLRALLGEMSAMVLGGQRAIPQKLLQSGFTFKFPHLNDALREALT